MTPLERVLAALDNPGRSGSGWQARCRAHDDHRASLSLNEGDDGRVLLKCHAGCELPAIVRALNLAERDLFPPRKARTSRRAPLGRIVKTYDYTDEAGVLLFQTLRYEPKDFRQRRPNGNGGWVWSLNGVQRVLYKLPAVLKTARAGYVVFLTEGEKDVDELGRLGLVATTNPQGAGKWCGEYTNALKGCRGVVIFSDNDPPGRAHADEVARSLHAGGVPVKVVNLPGLLPKGDVSDWIAAGGTRAQLDALIKAEPRWQPSARPPAPVPANVGASPAEDARGPVLVKVSSVQPERVEWLWRHRIPLGKVTVLDGDPGLGKSTLTLDLAAHVSKGTPMPGDSEHQEPGGVVLLSAEDGIADTIRPRLEAAGADLERVAVMTAIKDAQGSSRPPSLPGDLQAIRQAMLEGGARFLVVDPLMAFLASNVDSHRDQDVRGALHLIAELAEETGAAVVLVRHLNKTAGGHPIYRGGGSIGIIGAARAGLLVAPDPADDSRRILAVTKSNLAPMPPSLAFRLVPVGETSAISWEGEAACSAHDLLAAQREDGDGAGPREEAEAFLREVLGDGHQLPAKNVRKQARDAGIADRTLDRAKARLGVKAKHDGRPGEAGRWLWCLPEERQVDPEDATPQGWRSSGGGGALREDGNNAEAPRPLVDDDVRPSSPPVVRGTV